MTEQVAGRERPGAGPAQLREALASFASGVTLVTIADGRDDIGTTVSAFCPLSAEPPLVLVALLAESYPAEVLGRPDGPAGFAVTLLAARQRVLAGRFAAAGRPRGRHSGALIPAGGLAALDCQSAGQIPAGDHVMVIGRVLDVAYVADAPDPLIRFRGQYPSLSH